MFVRAPYFLHVSLVSAPSITLSDIAGVRHTEKWIPLLEARQLASAVHAFNGNVVNEANEIELRSQRPATHVFCIF